ncbi:MAG: YkvA family protein [Pseudomonadota bacterium]
MVDPRNDGDQLDDQQCGADRGDFPLEGRALSEILEPGDEKRQAKNRSRVERGFWRTFRKAAGQMPFAEDVAASYFCAMDSDTPVRVRGTLLAALAYFVLPTDLLPDFIVGFGFTDDIAVLTYVFSTLKQNLRPAHYDLARDALDRDGLMDDFEDDDQGNNAERD